MFKLIWAVLKVSLFTASILVLSHVLTWDGKTISDQIGSHLSGAQRVTSPKKIKKWTKELLKDSKIGVKKFETSHHKRPTLVTPQKEIHAILKEERTKLPKIELIERSERQKLKKLIQDLNTSSSNHAQK